jgi:5-methylcytosine-specific restriction protein B
MAPVMKILTGAPGTGKTYQAAEEAVLAVDGNVPGGGRAALLARHEQLVEAGDIIWVTFHPSYSYEDFVEGFRPVERNGTIVYDVRPGPFLQACHRCVADTPRARFDELKPGDIVPSSTGTKYEVIHAEQGVLVLSSDVNRTNAVASTKAAVADWWTIDKFLAAGVRPSQLSFSGKNAARRTAVAQQAGIASTLLNNAGHLRAVLEHVMGGGQPIPRPVALVIDELNRADLSRVFGELMTLIERDKRAGAPEERRVVLPYSQAPLAVPDTLSIIATMNTADRSLAEIDLALRRRFEFVDMVPQPALAPIDWGAINVSTWLARRNEALGALGFADNEIGHAELMAHALEVYRVAQGFADDQGGRRRALAGVLRAKVVPLLQDLFRVDWRQAEAVLGRAGLLEERAVSQTVEQALDEYLVGDEAGAGRPADWWDPGDPAWDSNRFAQAMTR